MIGFIIALTYVAEVLGALGVVVALGLLVLSGPERQPTDRRRTETTDDAGTTTYWLGAEPISRREYDHLSRRR